MSFCRSKTKIYAAFLATTLYFQMAVTITAAPGDLDPTFGNAGTFVDSPSYNACYGMYPNALALQADGKILVAGKLYNQCSTYGYLNDPVNIRRVLLRRYLSNGTPDDGGGSVGGFGMNGFAVDEIFVSPNVYGEAFDVAVQPDGRIVVAGSKATRIGTMAAVWRFTSGGELDETFGTDGLITFATDGTQNASRKLVVLANGKILVAGYSSAAISYFIWLQQLNLDGTIDTSFGTNGKTFTGLNYDLSIGLAVNTATGDIFVGGATGSGSNARATVGKRYPNGNNFGGFGTVGKSVLPDCVPGPGYVSTYPLTVTDLRFQSTGRLLVSSRMNFGNFSMTPGVHRLMTSGAVDTTFYDPAQPQMCNSIATNATWTRVMPNDLFYSGSRRLFPNGPLDTSFNLTQAGFSTQIQPADGKVLHLSMESVLKANQSAFDSRVKLFRVLP